MASTPQVVGKSFDEVPQTIHSDPLPNHKKLQQEIDQELSDEEFDVVLEEVRQREKIIKMLARVTLQKPSSAVETAGCLNEPNLVIGNSSRSYSTEYDGEDDDDEAGCCSALLSGSSMTSYDSPNASVTCSTSEEERFKEQSPVHDEDRPADAVSRSVSSEDVENHVIG